jgi:hypothetical protein
VCRVDDAPAKRLDDVWMRQLEAKVSVHAHLDTLCNDRSIVERARQERGVRKLFARDVAFVNTQLPQRITLLVVVRIIG